MTRLDTAQPGLFDEPVVAVGGMTAEAGDSLRVAGSGCTSRPSTDVAPTPAIGPPIALGASQSVLPPGLLLHPALIDRATEQALLAMIAGLPLHPARYKAYTARRRVLAWRRADDLAAQSRAGAGREAATGTATGTDGGGDEALTLGTLDELPPALLALRAQMAAFAGIAPEDIAHAMVTEYTPGTPLGWHRDAPQYGLVVGVSLAGPACLRFRPFDIEAPRRALRREDVLQLDLAPRSAYVMRGPARWAWQHSVAPVPALRYAVTMRTLRG